MEDNDTVKLEDLRARIARADYDIDTGAVAEAFIRRMVAVHGALRRADVRALLGDVYDEIEPAQNRCS